MLRDGTEISFEGCDFDSEPITLIGGHDRIDGYTPFEKVSERWNGVPEIKAVG